MKKLALFLFLALCTLSSFVQAESKQVNCGDAVVIQATAQQHYHFVKWSDNNTDNPRTISDVHNNASYTAIFAKDSYTATFVNYDNSTLYTTDVEYLETPQYGGNPNPPTRPADAQYTYQFSGWLPNVAPITANTTYEAQYTPTLRQYDIRFVNYDGTELQNSKWDYGATPVYTGSNPTKPADAHYTYEFSGWDPAIEPVSGETTYTAQYNSIAKTYHITFYNEDGTTVFYEADFEYGTLPATPTNPEKPSDGIHTYVFAGWSPTLTTVTESATYTATFSDTQITYTLTVISDNEDLGTVSGSGTWPAGSTQTIKATVADDCYEFDKWSDGDTNAERQVYISSDLTLTATFRRKTFTITIQSNDATMGGVSFVTEP